jgi:hypothetical protein
MRKEGPTAESHVTMDVLLDMMLYAVALPIEDI